MADLVTSAQFKSWANITDTNDDTVIAFMTAAASTAVRTWCGRSFNVAGSDSDTVRYFEPLDACNVLLTSDCFSVTSLATDDGDTGAWGTAWTVATDYQLNPVGGIGPTGETGWPYTSITAVGTRTFPNVARPAVKITGKWGWAAVPADVFMATLNLVSEFYKAKGGGYETYTTDNGFSIIRRNKQVADLLLPYRRGTANDARFVVL